ncbi:MAG: type II toxin-antitoxin system RelB/DinJ family antitoxin [Dissulfurispiraceae bacterium]
MSKTTMVHARIQEDLKTATEKIFRKLGLSTTEAIAVFFSQVRLRKGLPFDVKIPNKTTIETFSKTDAGLELNEYESMAKFKEKMGAK